MRDVGLPKGRTNSKGHITISLDHPGCVREVGFVSGWGVSRHRESDSEVPFAEIPQFPPHHCVEGPAVGM
jgi:hypothetical protein